MNFFLWLKYLFLDDLTSFFCSSLLDLRILITCRHGKIAFWRIVLICFLPNVEIHAEVSIFSIARNVWLNNWLKVQLQTNIHHSILLYVEKIKFTAVYGVRKCWGYIDSALIMTNGIRRSECFRQKILDSCKFISDCIQSTALYTSIFSLQPAEYKLCMVHTH